MNDLSRVLRAIAPEQLKAASVRARALQLGWPVQSFSSPPQGALLRLKFQSAEGALQALVRAADWAPRMLPELPGLAWSQLDAGTAGQLFGGAASVELGIDALDTAQCQCHGLAPEAVESTELAERVELATAVGPLWIQSLDWRAPPLRALPALRLALQLQLCRIELPTRRLRRLRRGDVVLLGPLQGIARYAGRPVFSFYLDTDSLIVTNFFDQFSKPRVEPTAPVPSARAPRLDLNRLPLAVDVSLHGLELSLAELAALQPQAVLALPVDAARQVRLLVDGHCVAVGELVQVGDGLGVQLDSVLVAS